MTQAAQDILQGQLETIRAKFISLLDDRLDELECLREQIDHEDQRQNALYHIQFIAHKIYGSAATLGLTDSDNQQLKRKKRLFNI